MSNSAALAAPMKAKSSNRTASSCLAILKPIIPSQFALGIGVAGAASCMGFQALKADANQAVNGHRILRAQPRAKGRPIKLIGILLRSEGGIGRHGPRIEIDVGILLAAGDDIAVPKKRP